MDAITVIDSSDDESSKPTKKHYDLPIIVHVESASKVEPKPPIITNIGECTLTLTKKRKCDVIEIIDDSDEENHPKEKYNEPKRKTEGLFVSSSIETNHKNVSCLVNARVPIMSLGNTKNDIQTTNINISVSGRPNIKKIKHTTNENFKSNEVITPKKVEEAHCILLTDSDSDSEIKTEKKDDLVLQISKKEVNDKSLNMQALKNPKSELDLKPSVSNISFNNEIKKSNSPSPKNSNADVIKSEEHVEQQHRRLSANESNLKQTDNSVSEDKTQLEKNEEAFEQFLQIYREIANSERMNLVIDKIKKYYDSAHSAYKKSPSFYNLIIRTCELVRTKKNYYWYIKDFIEELRARKSLETAETHTNDLEKGSKMARIVNNKEEKVQRLQSAMKKILKILHDLEQKEIDFDNENDSVYLLQDRYERRMVKIYNKLCELTNEHPSAGRAIKRKFTVAIGSHQSINNAVQDLINKKKEFPDYHDILKIVKSCNEKEALKMTSVGEAAEARKVFEHIGSELQRRRQADYYLSISDYLQAGTDPAEKDPQLCVKLKKNHEENKHKIPEIFNKYVEKAEQMCIKEEEVHSDDQSDSDQSNSGEDDKDSENDDNDGKLISESTKL
uniref:Putative histone binding domain of the death-domain associated protein n=1 Tax=Xenopsylla cheopis TaxID=163159 RepID=A0A6M2DQX9_XENCH